MKLPKGSNCCCCTLEWCAKIIGCLELIVYTIFIILTIIAIVVLGRYYYTGADQLLGVYVVNLILKCNGLIIVTILLVGIVKRKFLLLRPWMVFAILEVIMIVISVVMNSIHLDYSTDNPTGSLYGLELFFIIFDGFWLIMKFLFFIIIYKHHKSLMDVELERLNKLHNTTQVQQQQSTNQVPYQQTQQIPNQQSNSTPYPHQPNPTPYTSNQQISYQEHNQLPHQQNQYIPYQQSHQVPQQQTLYQRGYDPDEDPIQQTAEPSYQETSEAQQKKNYKLNIEQPSIIYTNTNSTSNYH